jgi:tetratricopeptide (TPR) repeat protein
MGLWIFNRETGQLAKVLNGMACYARWSPDGSKLAVFLAHPFLETWITDLPKGRSTVEALGILQTRDEHHRQMADRYERILELTPDDSLNHGRLAACYSLLNDKEASKQAFIRYWTVRIEQNPNNAFLYGCRGSYYHNARMPGEALSDYEAALRLKPDYVGVLNNLAWLYAACPQAEFRNGAKAVENAKKACELTRWKNPNYIGTLAAAYAEAGDFDAAVESLKKAIDLLPEGTSAESRAEYESYLKLYQEGKPRRGW